MGLTKVSTDGVKDDAITAGKIPANAIGVSELASSSVTNVKVAAGNIDNTAIGNNQVSLNKLVQGTSSNDGKFLRANNGANPSFESLPAGITVNNQADNRVITATGTTDTLNAESGVVIDSSGNLNIPNDSGKIQLGASSDLTIGHDGNDNIIDCATTKSLRVRMGGSNQFEFLTGGGTKMNDGRFAIFGDSSDLQIGHSSSFNKIIYANADLRFEMGGATRFGISNTNGRLERSFSGASGTNNDAMWFVDSDSTSGTYIRFWQTVGGANQIGSISHGTSSTSYNTSSDYRLKENVTLISDGITRLKTLKPSRFNFKVDKDTTVDGFLAHEVTAVPEAITGTKDEVAQEDEPSIGVKKGDPIYQSIDQAKLVPLLTAALQEAIAKIEVLETKVAALEAKS